MSIRLKYLEARPAGRAPVVGEAWQEPGYVTPSEISLYRGRFNADFRTNGLGKRAPLVVRLPDGSDFPIDFQPGLKVTGIPDAITVEGKIDLPGRFVGYIRDGQLMTEAEAAKAEQKDAAPADADADAVSVESRTFRQG